MAIELPMRFENEPLLWTVDQVYSQTECIQFIEQIERSNPSLATNNPMYRNQDRVMFDDPEMAAELFKRLLPHLPQRIKAFQLVGLNERFRLYRYRVGQSFSPHMDHWYRPSERMISLYTVLVYFNDDFAGGETRFQEQIEATVVPKAGRAAIFQHKIRHEGCVVTQGVKYGMRTEVMYKADDVIGTVLFS